MIQKILTVSELNFLIGNQLQKNKDFKKIRFEGEIVKISSTAGHWYFDVKDEKNSIPCIAWRSVNARFKSSFASGDKVVITGEVGFYETNCRVQIYVHEMELNGIGQWYAKLNQLREKLERQGYFSIQYKKKIPPFASDIGVICANDSAALSDIKKTIMNRWPNAKITLYPSLVQGVKAHFQLCKALKYADSFNHDVLIIARGGGSIEDLWCFNEELLVKMIFSLKTPIISGVGHQQDTTLCDLVSDLRASTPTQAASYAVSDVKEVSKHLESYKSRLQSCIQYQLNTFQEISKKYSVELLHDKLVTTSQEHKEKMRNYRSKLKFLISGLKKSNQYNQKYGMLVHLLKMRSQEYRNLFDRKSELLLQLQKQYYLNKKKDFEIQQKKLELLNPNNILKRGYSISKVDHKIINNINDVTIGEKLETTIKDGVLISEIKEIHHGKEKF